MINTDLGGTPERTLTTNALEMYSDSSIQIGETQMLTGSGTVSVEWKDLNPGEKYIWYAVVTDEFVVGYGLDYNDVYRNLPYIGVLKPEVYENK